MDTNNKIDASVENSQLKDGNFTVLTTPKRLDADQYSADDLDGVTESLFGSGNMAYAILQSTQSNIAVDKQGAPALENALDQSGGPGFLPIDHVQNQSTVDLYPDGDHNQTYIEQPAGGIGTGKVESVGTDGNLTHTTVNTLGGSTLASNVSHYRVGGGGGGSSRSNSDSTVSNSVTNNEGDTVENITNIIEGDIGDILTIINNFLENAGLSLDLNLTVLDTLLANLHLGVEDSIEGLLETGVITDNLAAIVQDLTGLDLSLLPDAGASIAFDLLSGENIDDGNDISIAGLDTPDIDLDLIEDIVGDIDINLDLPTELLNLNTVMDGVENLAESLGNFDLASPGEVFDILGAQGVDGLIDLDLFGNELTREFSPTLDDALEQVTDLVDETLEFTDSLVGSVTDGLNLDGGDEGIISQIVDPLLDGAEDIIDDLAGDITDDLTDQLTDITDDVTDSLDNLLGNDGVETLSSDVGLDDLGDIGALGDIEGIADNLSSTIDSAIDFLNPESGEGDGFGAEVETVQNWTESVIPNADQLFDNLMNNQTDVEALPDPTGVVAEGLGSLNIGGNDIDIGGLGGGLFG